MEDMGLLPSYLRADEQLLWQGSPDPQVWFTLADLWLVPFSIMWCGFAIFWEAGVTTAGAPVFFKLWGIPFVAAGLYGVVGRFLYKRYRKSRTVYGITTQRAMILVGRSFTDMPLRDQPVTVKRSRNARHASVIIGRSAPRAGWGRRRVPVSYANTGMDVFAGRGDLPFAFYDVADPNSMLVALDQARSESNSTPLSRTPRSICLPAQASARVCIASSRPSL